MEFPAGISGKLPGARDMIVGAPDIKVMFRKNARSKMLHIVPWLVAIAFFMQMLDGTILNTALPGIARSLNENPLEIQSVVISYIITAAFFLPLSGWLADRFGSRKVFMSAIVLFTLGSLFCAMSRTLAQLVSARVFQGLGGALLIPVGRLAILKLYPPRLLVPILSFIMIPGLIGPLLGPVLGGFIVQYASWHWIFLINLPVGMVSFFLTYFWMPDMREENPPSFDIAGFVLFSLFILLISVVVNDSKLMPLTAAGKTGLFVLSFIMLGLYYVHARIKPKPLFPLGVFHTRTFSIGLLSNICARLSGGAIPFLMPLMLQVGLKYTPSQSGSMLLVLGVMSITSKVFAPRLIKNYGFRPYLIAATLALSGLIACFSLAGENTPAVYIVFLLAVLGAVNSLQFTGLTSVTLIDLSPAYASAGNTLLSVGMQVSVSMGVGAASVILGILTQHLNITEGMNLLPVFHRTFFILGMMSAFSAIPFVFLPSRQPAEKKAPVRKK